MTKLRCAIQAKIAVADKIALKLDLDMVDNICKNLKYELDSQIDDRPVEAKYFSREQEDDETGQGRTTMRTQNSEWRVRVTSFLQHVHLLSQRL